MHSQIVSLYDLEGSVRVFSHQAHELFDLYNDDDLSKQAIRQLISQVGICFTSGPISRDTAYSLEPDSVFVKELRQSFSEYRSIFIIKDVLSSMRQEEQKAVLSHELAHFIIPTYGSDSILDIEQRADDFSIRRYGVVPLLRGLKRLRTNYENLCGLYGIKPFNDMFSELILDRRIHRLQNLARHA